MAQVIGAQSHGINVPVHRFRPTAIQRWYSMASCLSLGICSGWQQPSFVVVPISDEDFVLIGMADGKEYPISAVLDTRTTDRTHRPLCCWFIWSGQIKSRCGYDGWHAHCQPFCQGSGCLQGECSSSVVPSAGRKPQTTRGHPLGGWEGWSATRNSLVITRNSMFRRLRETSKCQENVP